MKKIFKVLAAVMLIITVACSLASCFSFNFGSSTNYEDFASGKVYLKGEQTVTLPSSTSFEDITFERDATVADFTLGDGWGSKTITGFRYVDEHSVELTISGSMDASTATDPTYVINVANHALSGNTTARYYVTVKQTAPRMSVTDNSYMVSNGKGKLSSTYVLPYGSFIAENCTKENITAEDSEAVIETVEVTDQGYLKVKVSNYDMSGDATAYVTIAAECTTFNHAVKIAIGDSFASADLCD